MNDWTGFAWLAVLLICNAFFVAGEFAVISARRSQIEPLAEQGNRRAVTALWAMEHANLMLAMSQLGITVCSLLILNVSEPSLHYLLAGPLEALHWDESVVSVITFTTALIIVSFLHVVFGEMVPKNLSFSLPDRAVLLLAPPMVFLARFCGPVIGILNWAANGVLALFRVQSKNEATSAYSLEEVRTIVAESQRAGVLDDTSGTLSATFEFTQKQVRDVKVPFQSIISFQHDSTPIDLEKAVVKHGFSRYPVLGDDGEVDGYVHVKDFIDLDEYKAQQPFPSKRVRHVLSIFEGTELEDALATMRRNGSHLARTFDGTGRTTGTIFLEDIIEELVGEVRDASQRGVLRARVAPLHPHVADNQTNS